MGHYLLCLIASLFLVPWGLCLPQGHGDLAARQSTPPADTCTAAYLGPDMPVWVPVADGYVSIQVHAEADNLKGYFLLVVDIEGGAAHTSSSYLASADAEISPFYNSGTTVVHQDTNSSSYQIWIDCLEQKTPNFYKNNAELDFAGVWPRVDMFINSTANAEYVTVSWLNPAQGAIAVSLVDYEMYKCGKGQ